MIHTVGRFYVWRTPATYGHAIDLFCMWRLGMGRQGLRDRLVRWMRRDRRPFNPLHQFRMTHPRDTFFFWRAIKLGTDVITPFALGLLHLYRNAMYVGPSILADTGDLPGDFHPRLAPRDLELVVCDFFRDVHRSEASDTGELVAKVAVDGPEPIGKRDHCFTVGVKHHVAVVNVQHVGRFHERVIEVFVRGIQRMVDLEGTGILEQGSVNIDVAPKIPCPSIGRSATGKGIDCVTPRSASRVAADRLKSIAARCANGSHKTASVHTSVGVDFKPCTWCLGSDSDLAARYNRDLFAVALPEVHRSS